MDVSRIVIEESAVIELEATTKQEVFEELIEPIVKSAPDIDRSRLLKGILLREAMSSTGMGGGIALPHCKAGQIGQIRLAFGRSRKGIDFWALDGSPVHFVLLSLVPHDHLLLDWLPPLAKISGALRDKQQQRQFFLAHDRSAIYSLLVEMLHRSSIPVNRW